MNCLYISAYKKIAVRGFAVHSYFSTGNEVLPPHFLCNLQYKKRSLLQV